MVIVKKSMRIYKAVLLMAVPLFALLSCGNEYNADEYKIEINNVNNSSNSNNNLGTIIFYNSSSRYHISIHQDDFTGTVLVDKLSPKTQSLIEVVPKSTPYMFSIAYWFQVVKDIESGSGDVWTKSTDAFQEQKSQQVDVGKEYTLRVFQQSEAKFTESFLKIFNASNAPFDLRGEGGVSYLQEGNKVLDVPIGKYGVYKIAVGDIEGRSIYKSGSFSLSFPSFTAESGYIYNFRFDGTNVVQLTEEQI